MKIGELIQRIQSLYSRGVQSDDSRLTPRHIYNKLLTSRYNILYQYNEAKKYKLSDWNYQTLSCVELIQVPSHECNCLPEIDCGILRTKYELPKILSFGGKLLIQNVSTIDNSIQYDKTSISKSQHKSKGNKYAIKIKPQWYIQNKYLYINDINASKYIKITAVFDDPLQAKSFPSACNDNGTNTDNNCINIFEEEFNVDSELLEPIIQNCVQELIGTFSKMQEDDTNNTKDNRLEQNK